MHHHRVSRPSCETVVTPRPSVNIAGRILISLVPQRSPTVAHMLHAGQASLVYPTAKLDLSHILQSSPSPPPPRAPQPSLARSISVPTATGHYPLVSSPATSTASHFSNATAPANFYGEPDRRAHGPLTTLAPLASSAAASSKRGSPATPHPLASPAKKQSKWSPQEDNLIVQLRGSGMKWEDISKRLPGRSSISCRLHYQNYLERKSEWDEEKKNKLARLYDR